MQNHFNPLNPSMFVIRATAWTMRVQDKCKSTVPDLQSGFYPSLLRSAVSEHQDSLILSSPSAVSPIPSTLSSIKASSGSFVPAVMPPIMLAVELGLQAQGRFNFYSLT